MSISRVKVYYCPVCNEEFEDEDEALGCCNLQASYLCPNPDCSCVYEEEEDALQCCFKSEEKWRCDDCENYYDDPDEAEDCCE